MGSAVQQKVSSSSRLARVCLIAVELLVAIGAWYGGIGLIADNSIGMLPEWLEGTPFDTWTWPGVFLLLVVALPMTVAAVVELARLSWAYPASLVAGAAQVGWIIVQWLVMQRYFILQPVMLTMGVAVLLLAWAAHGGQPVLPRHGSRR